jgi:hypothetical protein
MENEKRENDIWKMNSPFPAAGFWKVDNWATLTLHDCDILGAPGFHYGKLDPINA